MSQIRILHFSDLHVGGSNAADQSVVLQAFFQDLDRMKGEAGIDLAIFSGDLAFSGKADQYSVASENFLARVLDKLNLAKTYLVLVPGNHDVDRSLVDVYEDAGLLQTLTSRDAVNDLLDNEKQLDRRLLRVQSWIEFTDSWYVDADSDRGFSGLVRTHKFEIAGLRIGVAAFNSAWRSSGDADYGHLLVGDRITKWATESLRDSDFKIAVMHHPIEWLMEFDARALALELHRHYVALLSGHLHEADPKKISRPEGTYLHSVAGSLYGDEGRDWPNCYTILELDTDKNELRAEFRVYVPGRERFDIGVAVAQSGQATFPLSKLSAAARDVVGDVTDNPSLREDAEQYLAQWVADQSVLSSMVPTTIEHRTGLERIRSHIVEPSFQRVPRSELSSMEDTSARQLATQDVIVESAGDGSLVIGGEVGTGVSTAALWLGMHIAEREQKIPILLHGNTDVDAGQRAFHTACRKALAGVGVVVGRDQPLPPLVVILNDVHKLTDKKLERLQKFADSLPDSRFIFGCEVNQVGRVERWLTASDRRLQVVYLGPLTRRQIRALVQKVVVDEDNEERVFSALTSISRATSFERVPFLLAALISVLAVADAQLNVTDEIGVIAAYSELLLGRSDRFENSRVSMTYQNREHLLQYVAGRLILDGDRGVVGQSELEKILTDYFRLVGWYQPVSHVVEDFVSRWVLFEVTPGQYAFRQRALQAYFAAGRAHQDKELRAYIMKDPLRWSALVEYMAGIPKNDEQLLDYLFTELPERLERSPLVTEVGTHLANYDEIQSRLNEFDESDNSKESEHLTHADMEQMEEMEERFEFLTESAASFEIAAPTATMDEAEKVAAYTRLVSQVLRSSELVENRELKQKVLSALVPRWGDLLDFAMNMLMGLEKSTRQRIAEDAESVPSQVAELIDEMPPVPAEVIMFMALSGTLSEVLDTLSSTKLDNLVETISEISEADPASGLVVLSLAADAHPSDWVSAGETLLASEGRKVFVRFGLLSICVLGLTSARTDGQRERVMKFASRCMLWPVDFPTKNHRSAAENDMVRRFRLFMQKSHGEIATAAPE